MIRRPVETEVLLSSKTGSQSPRFWRTSVKLFSRVKFLVSNLYRRSQDCSSACARSPYQNRAFNTSAPTRRTKAGDKKSPAVRSCIQLFQLSVIGGVAESSTKLPNQSLSSLAICGNWQGGSSLATGLLASANAASNITAATEPPETPEIAKS